MKVLSINFLLAALLLSSLSFTSCSDDDNESPTPIQLGSDITVNNTLQSDAITNGEETDIGILFGGAAGDYVATGTVSEGIEFPAYLLGLYDIDIDENSISFELVAPADDPTYMDFFRTLEAGTTDRYYLTFGDSQNISGFTSSNSSVNLRIDSDKVVVIEIGEGFAFNPGATFTISLN